MKRKELCERLKCISDKMMSLESELPYDYEQHDPDMAFMAEIRQHIYVVRRSLGSVRETVKDDRNWDRKWGRK